MRKGFDGVYGLVRERLLCEPLSGPLAIRLIAPVANASRGGTVRASTTTMAANTNPFLTDSRTTSFMGQLLSYNGLNGIIY